MSDNPYRGYRFSKEIISYAVWFYYRIQQLRRDNQRLAEELRKAAIVIDVQKKVGALLGWPLPKADPEEKP